MFGDFKPREGQDAVIERVATHRRAGIWMPMGGGKTVSTLTGLTVADMVEDVFPVLVLAPKRVARSTWPEEIEKWDHLRHLRTSTILGNQKERLAALRSSADVFTMNYDNLVWLREEMGDDWIFRTVVADELSRLKGFRLRQGGRRARALGEVAFDPVRRFIGLTGTPTSKGLQDLWGQTWYLDRGHRLGRTYTAFEQRWFQTGYNGFGLEAMPHAEKEIHGLLKDLYLTVESAEVDDPIFVPVMVELPPKVKRQYDTMQKDLIADLQSGEVTAKNAGDKTNKLAQITAGAVYTNDKRTEWDVLHDVKLEALDSIIEEAGGAPILVAYRFRHDLARLQKRYPSGRVLDDDPQTIRDWNAGKVPLLFAHPKSAGHGLNLQDGGHHLVFFSLDWNLEEFLQIIERIGPLRQKQSGHPRPVYVYLIMARGTVDEVMRQRHETREEVMTLLLRAMIPE